MTAMRLVGLFLLATALPAAELVPPDIPWPTAGWTVAAPETQGLDPTRLEAASAFIEQKCPTRYSLLVVRHGRIVYERYYHGARAADATNLCSISKSVLSVLAGIALDEGRWHDTGQTLEEFFPELIHADSDPRKRQIRLRDVFTMTAGFQWDDLGPGGSAGGDLSRCVQSADWLRCFLDAGMSAAPGTTFNYDTGLTHAVSALLTRETGLSTRAYAASRLFDPLGISCPRWSVDPQGYSTGGFDVWMTPRDLARFGLMVLRNGQWAGRQIVSPEWLDTSTRLRVRTGDAGWGFGDYGYFWWKKTVAGYPVTLASGYGGQNLFLVPELDLLMVTTARSDVTPPFEAYQDSYSILGEYVLKAVRGNAPVVNPEIVQTADGFAAAAAGSFATAQGSGFSLVERDWTYAMPADGWLPECIAGVCVRVGQRVAPVRYVRPDRVEFLIPPDLPAGRLDVEIRTPQGTASTPVDVQAVAPAFFGSVRAGQFFVTGRPVASGDVVRMWASGLGPSVPAAVAGAQIGQPMPLETQPQVLVAGQAAAVTEAVLAGAGMWQVDVRVPEGLAPGFVPVQVCVGALCSRSDALLEIAPR
ncbi:MAG: serine hydrolase [Paludibaculum sp.]